MPVQSREKMHILVKYITGFKILRNCASFECFSTNIASKESSLHLVAVYRPPKCSQAKFMSEFSALLEELSSTNHNSIILGDFNFPFNDSKQSSTQTLHSMLDCANFKQHVREPTHTNGNMLDLVISPLDSPFSLKITGHDWSVSSDHCAVLCNMCLTKPLRPRKTINVRKWKSLDCDRFNKDIAEFDLSSVCSLDAISKYNTIMGNLLEIHAPSTSLTVTERTSTPWYNSSVRREKTLLRKLERKWRKSNLTIDFEIYRHQKLNLKSTRDRAKADYVQSKLSDAKTSKDSFAVLNMLLHKKVEYPLPAHDNVSTLAESFATYFNDKIASVRQVFASSGQSVPISEPVGHCCTLDSFQPVSTDNIVKHINSSASKSCSHDPIPTWLLRKCPGALPMLCDIVNDSILHGCMPSTLKVAHVIPVLKKSTLDANDYKNYRPISNLAYTSKLIERVVSSQLSAHCDNNNIRMPYQSAYRKGHSTETALTKVQNDLLKAVDSQGGAVLVLLDLSAAFDTIDHTILMRTLEQHIGITGTALRWFHSYLSDRYQSVKIGKTLSSPRHLPYGVPQGSVLGPQLFSIYTQPLQAVIEAGEMFFHLYADDTQLYMAFNPKCSMSINRMQATIDKCTTNIGAWMNSHFLKLNGDKTELLVLTKPSLAHNTSLSIKICGSAIRNSDHVRDLGVDFDCFLKMDTHIRSVCKKAYYQLHLIYKVRKYIDEDAARTLVCSNVTSLLDYCNGLLIGLPASLLNLLQRVQNSAARVVKQLPKSSHITSILRDLHWLPISFRVDYKVLLLTFKGLNGLAPSYISNLLVPYTPSRTLRSSYDNLLTVPRHRSTTYGGRMFEVRAPQLWNNLPGEMRNITSLEVFKKSLKTHLFKCAFD